MFDSKNFISTKSYYNYPCAHRQWRHGGGYGKCALVHGYSRSFHFKFKANYLDECGFVVDYGSLQQVKVFLDDYFDHTLLLNSDDPLLGAFKELENLGACKLKTMPYGIGMEGTAKFVFETVQTIITSQTFGRCWVIEVEARENDKNSSIYLEG